MRRLLSPARAAGAALALALSLAGGALGCRMPVDPDPPAAPSGDEQTAPDGGSRLRGKVSLRAARSPAASASLSAGSAQRGSGGPAFTVLPDAWGAAGNSAVKYTITFTDEAPDGAAPLIFDITAAADITALETTGWTAEIPVGTYTVLVIAYQDIDNDPGTGTVEAARGEVSGFVVTYNSGTEDLPTSLRVQLSASQTAGDGLFVWNFTLPQEEGAVTADITTLTLTPTDDTAIDLTDSVTHIAPAAGSQSVPAGEYLLTIILSKKNSPMSIGFTDIVRIYSGLKSTATVDFSNVVFAANVYLRGTLNITRVTAAAGTPADFQVRAYTQADCAETSMIAPVDNYADKTAFTGNSYTWQFGIPGGNFAQLAESRTVYLKAAASPSEGIAVTASPVAVSGLETKGRRDLPVGISLSPEQYSVTYNGNAIGAVTGLPSGTQTLTFGVSTLPPASGAGAVTRWDHTLSGWWTAAEVPSDKTAYLPGAVCPDFGANGAAVTLYAQWESLINLTNSTYTGSGITYSSGVFTVSNGAKVRVVGTTASSRIVVQGAATVTLDSASITLWSDGSPLGLADGANLTLKLSGENTLTASGGGAGVRAPVGTTLKITSAAGDGSESGTLTATGGSTNGSGAGIGGSDEESGGTITIAGGTITAAGGSMAAGIGGGFYGGGGTITITGGTIIATSASMGAGIGGGYWGSGGNITISGGEVTSTSSRNAAGIGGGYSGAGGTITITGGTVNATGVNGGAGIGGGMGGAGGTIVISGGAGRAEGGENAPGGVGPGNMGSGGSFNGGPFPTDNPYEWGSESGADSINLTNSTCTGSGVSYSGGVFTVSDGADVTVSGSTAADRIVVQGTATVTLDGASINLSAGTTAASPLGLASGANLTLKLSGENTLTASGTEAGIHAPEGTTLTITSAAGDGSESGTLTATGGGNSDAAGAGAGIGGAMSEAGGTITIAGGTVNAVGGTYTSGGGGGAGIGGGGDWDEQGGSNTGTITISGGTVYAYGGSYAAGIGGGYLRDGGNITLSGGTVNATGGPSGAGIGGGYGGGGGTIRINSPGTSSGTATAVPSPGLAGGYPVGPGDWASGGTFNGVSNAWPVGPDESGWEYRYYQW